jgi:hypothetical protein
MSSTYSLTLRQNLGRKLTIQELDENFLNLQDIAQLGATSAAGGDALRDLLEDDEDALVIPEGGFFVGTERVEEIFKFDTSAFFDALEDEDPETFKAPIIRENGKDIIHTGTRISNLEGSSKFIMINGCLFPPPFELIGPGTFFMSTLTDDNNTDIYTYIEIINLSLAGVKYFFNRDIDREEYTHGFHFDGAIFDTFQVIIVTVPFDATTWEEVSVTVKELSTEIN